ncbi:hypothetical protein [Marivita sp. S2033]|uniref:hypothetical protein n=1 Tax=Marivita sp. S2033 TaxID=3373187 RepID=UPI0039827B8B
MTHKFFLIIASVATFGLAACDTVSGTSSQAMPADETGIISNDDNGAIANNP